MRAFYAEHRRLFWLLVGIAITTLSVLFAPLIAQFPEGLVRDDGFFYAKISYNIGVFGNSSFDGINHTDGYHQLWAYLLASVSFVVRWFTLNRETHLAAYLAVNTVLICMVAHHIKGSFFLRLSAFLLMMICGLLMEGFLVALCLVILAHYFLSGTERAPMAALAAAFCLPIARIDSIIIAFPFLVYALILRRKSFDKLIHIFMALGLFSHFALMRLIHGEWFTVSSQAKASMSSQGLLLKSNLFTVGFRSFLPVNPMPLIFLILAIISLCCLLASEKNRLALALIWLGATSYEMMHLTLNVIRPWYFTAPYMLFLLIIAASSPRLRKPYVAAIGVVFFLCFGAFGATMRNLMKMRPEAKATREFLTKVDETVPSNEPIYMIDGSGFAGWALNAPIVNGDGLVNSHEYMRLRTHEQLTNYLTDKRIKYVMTNTPIKEGDPVVNYHGLAVKQDHAELVMKRDKPSAFFFTNLALWRLR